MVSAMAPVDGANSTPPLTLQLAVTRLTADNIKMRHTLDFVIDTYRQVKGNIENSTILRALTEFFPF